MMRFTLGLQLEKSTITIRQRKLLAFTTFLGLSFFCGSVLAANQKLTQITATKTGQVSTLYLNAQPSQYKTMRLHHPERIVIDMNHVDKAKTLQLPNKTTLDQHHFSAIRVGQHKNFTRVVVDLKPSAATAHKKINIHFTKLAQPQPLSTLTSRVHTQLPRPTVTTTTHYQKIPKRTTTSRYIYLSKKPYDRHQSNCESLKNYTRGMSDQELLREKIPAECLDQTSQSPNTTATELTSPKGEGTQPDQPNMQANKNGVAEDMTPIDYLYNLKRGLTPYRMTVATGINYGMDYSKSNNHVGGGDLFDDSPLDMVFKPTTAKQILIGVSKQMSSGIYELELLHMRSNIHSMDQSNNTISKKLKKNPYVDTTAALLNYYTSSSYEGDHGWLFGLGIGLAERKYSVGWDHSGSNPIYIKNKDRITWAAQPIIGYRYNISPTIAMLLDYRLLIMGKDINTVISTPCTSCSQIKTSFMTHTINLGLSYRFTSSPTT